MSFEQKRRALITGASSGIGKTTALAFAKAGIDVALVRRSLIDLNLTSVFQCIMGILPILRDRGTGTIIHVASIAGKQTFPGWGAYCVSKAGLIAFPTPWHKKNAPTAFASQLFVPVQ